MGFLEKGERMRADFVIDVNTLLKACDTLALLPRAIRWNDDLHGYVFSLSGTQ